MAKAKNKKLPVRHNEPKVAIKGTFLEVFKVVKKNKEQKAIKPPKILKLSIEHSGLSNRLCNILKKEGINTVDELAKYGWIDLLGLKNVGTKSITAIENALAKYGLRLAP